MDIGDVDREECTEEAADVAGEDEPAFWFWEGIKCIFELSHCVTPVKIHLAWFIRDTL